MRHFGTWHLRLGHASLAWACILCTSTALAQTCAIDHYDHNGSLTSVRLCGNELVITYEQPRSAMKHQGVGPGTVLFHGSLSGSGSDGDVTGTAYVFKSGCMPAGYAVTGWKIGRQIALEGWATVRNSECEQRDIRRDLLEFDREW